MSMPNSKAYTERLTAVLSATEAKLNDIKTTYGNFGFKNAASKFTKSNVLKDLNEIRGLGIPEEEEIPSLGTVKGYSAVAALPLKGHTKNGVKYVDPNNPEVVHTANLSNTLKTDRADGNVDINRWTTRNIFKFKDEYYGYDRCVYKIPLADLANGIVIDGGEDTPHANTLVNYPYPEEIVMIAHSSERNFIHFINVQYSDGHYGHYNGRNYNFMIVKDRIRHGIVNESGDGFKKYTSVYANDVNTELAYISGDYLFLPVPDEVYGEEMLDTIWDCRVVWRSDSPNRNISVELALEENAESGQFTWTEGTISNTERIWSDVCYGDGKFVAVAMSDTIFAYSTDGITWTEVTISETSRAWKSVCYGDGKFVAVTYGSNIFAYSTDGITWTEGTISETIRNWETVYYGNGKFIVVALVTNIFAYSTDGITWTEGTISETKRSWVSVCYGNGKFVAVASGNPIYFAYSTDGIAWTEGTSSISGYWLEVCYGNGKFVAVGGSDSFAYSTDGITWTEGTSSISGYWFEVCYGNGKFVAVDEYDFVYSTDGINWTGGTIIDGVGDGNYLYWNSVCYGNNKFIALANNDRGNTSLFAYGISEDDNLTPYFDFDISNDRVHLIGASGEAINKNRNKISGFDVVETPKKSIFSSFVMTNTGDILIAPTFEKSYKPFDSNTAGTPNQIFPVTNNHYIGFYYYDPSNRGNSADGDSSNRTSQLYFNLFDSTLKVISADESSEIYPCSNFNPSFTNTNNPIIKVFPYSINKTTGTSSFLVFTDTKLYKFNFTVSGNTLINNSFEEVMSYTAAKYIMRISANEFLIYSSTGTSVAKVNINTKTSTDFTNASGNLVLGRNSAAYLANGNLSGVQYDNNILSITAGTQTVNPSAIYNIHGKYGYFKNSSGVNTMCKLVENYSFDVELDPLVNDGPAFIYFMINGSTKYTAEQGMTWSQWFASDYNTTGNTEADAQSISSNGAVVELGDVIVSGMAYEVEFAPPIVTKILRPIGDGGYINSNNSNITSFGCSKFPAEAESFFSLVNEEIADDSATYVSCDVGFDYGSYGNGDNHNFRLMLNISDEAEFNKTILSGQVFIRAIKDSSYGIISYVKLYTPSEDGTSVNTAANIDLSDQSITNGSYTDLNITFDETKISALNAFISENGKLPKILEIYGYGNAPSDMPKSSDGYINVTQVYVKLECV